MTDPVPAQEFKAAMRRFASGVCVVTCVVDGVDHAMTASAFSSVSLDPALVLVCVRRSARFHEALHHTSTWGVSILDDQGEPAARWFATPGRPLLGQLSQVPHRRGSSGVALITASLAQLECRTSTALAAGDHDIVVGAVESVHLTSGLDPLVYWAGEYRALHSPRTPRVGPTA